MTPSPSRARTLALVLAAVALGALVAPRPTGAQGRSADQRPLTFEHLPTEVDLQRAYGALTESERTQLNQRLTCYRAKVPGGWLVTNPTGALVFVPDAGHAWGGGALPR